MAVVDTLVTRFLGDNSSYVSAAGGVASATDRLMGKLPQAQQAAIAAAAAFGKITGAILLLSGTSFRAFANFDSLTKSLQAIEGSAQRAGESLKVLKDIAKLPGLGLEEAIQGFSGLRMQGLNQAQSERVLRATGNANAIMGGGREELARVLMTLQKMLGSPYLQGDEVNQLAEARIPGRRALINAFGTADTEELKRRGITAAQAVEAIISELEKMPQAMDSPKNQMENLGVAFNQIMVQIGSGLSVYILPHLQAFGAALERLINADVFSVVGESLANWFSSFEGLSNGLTTWEGAIIGVTAAVAGAIDAMANINRVLITIAKNPMVQLAAAMIGVAVGPVGVIGGTAFAGLSGFIDSSLERAQQMSQKVRDHERYGTGGISSFLGQGMEASLAGFKIGNGPETPGADAASLINNRATNHLAAIESNTRAMVDLQRMILGGGNIAAMGVTPIELSDIRRGGTGEEMVMSGIRKMMMELGVSSFGRRGMVR